MEMDYANILTQKVQETKPSGIRKFFDMLTGRKDVISLTVGQPDFATPWHIREAGIRSIENGKTYYTANAGMPALHEEISAYMERRFRLRYDAKDEIVVTVGGSEAIDLCIRALVEVGDEVIIPMPSFVCYEPLVQMSGGKPVIIETKNENKFKLTAEELRAAITPKTKLLILPYPNNPTGAIMDEGDLKAIAEVLRGTNIMVLSDEIYAELTYGQHHTSIASIDGMKEHTIIASGFSKAYAMTGWRLGYLLGPKGLMRQLNRIHQYGIMCASTMSQYAGIEAMKNGDEDIEYMKSQYNRRRIMILEGLNDIGLSCFAPEGAFYVFPKLPERFGNSEAFCKKLMDEEGVAIVPGSAFGNCGEGFARISYAYSVSHIEKALDRMGHFLKQ